MQRLTAKLTLRTSTVLLIALAMSGSALGQEQAAPPYREPVTGIAFPAKLAAFRKSGIREYEDPMMRVRARYRGPGMAQADVYIYTLGLKGIGTGIRSPKVKAHFEAVKGAIAKCTAYKAVVQKSEQERVIKTPKREVPALCACFEYTECSMPRVSHVLVTAYKDNFLKVVYVFPKQKQKGAEEALEGFLSALGAQMP